MATPFRRASILDQRSAEEHRVHLTVALCEDGASRHRRGEKQHLRTLLNCEISNRIVRVGDEPPGLASQKICLQIGYPVLGPCIVGVANEQLNLHPDIEEGDHQFAVIVLSSVIFFMGPKVERMMDNTLGSRLEGSHFALLHCVCCSQANYLHLEQSQSSANSGAFNWLKGRWIGIEPNLVLLAITSQMQPHMIHFEFRSISPVFLISGHVR